MITNQKSNYTCLHCGTTNDAVGVVQEEIHYYALYIATDQLEDFHGDDEVKSQKYFCLNCEVKIKDHDFK